MNVLDKIKNVKFWQKVLIYFLMIQPFLDCYILYSDEVINFFHFSPTTILRTIFIIVLFVVFFFWHSNKKERVILILYACFIGVYFGFHHVNALHFSKNNPDNFTYSIIEEIFYFLRMIFPALIAYVVYKMEWTYTKVQKIFLFVVSAISLIVIVSNLFCISLTSYGGNHLIKGNIFVWFIPGRNDLSYEWLASKGWFCMANQISGLLSLTLPLTIYFTLTDYSKKKMVILCSQIVTMMLIGTRVASIGWIPIMVVMIIMYLYMVHVKKMFTLDKKLLGKLVIVIILGSLLLTKAPVMNRTTDMDYFEREIEIKMKYEKKHKKKKGSLYKELSMSAINPEYYIELYPYKEHKKFWYYVLDLPYYSRIGNRRIEKLVTVDLYKNNKNSNDKFLGMSFSRMRSGEIYIEQDFLAHYYTLGIVGTILLCGIYILLFIWKGIDVLVHYKTKFNLARLTLLLSLGLTMCVAYLSGHVIDELIVTIYLGFISGLLLKDNDEWGDVSENS